MHKMNLENSITLEESSIHIRKGDEQDYEQILALITAFSVFQKTPEKVKITLAQMMEDKAIFQCLVAEANNTIIAFASFFFAYYSWSGKAVYLDDLYVKDEFRKQNIGTQLLNAVIEYAKAHQCKSVRWQVSKWNENAIHFYKKMGAVVDDTEMNCVYTLE